VEGTVIGGGGQREGEKYVWKSIIPGRRRVFEESTWEKGSKKGREKGGGTNLGRSG